MLLKILVADDYVAFREFLKSVVAKMPEMCIAGEAADGEEAVRLVGLLKPDLVLMDIEMPRMGGPEATRRIKAWNTPTKVVLLSALADEGRSKSAADCGADGFLAKGTSVREMITALRQVVTHSSEARQPFDAQFSAEEDESVERRNRNHSLQCRHLLRAAL
jgi:DNA-binding NarL/FixJ family response regulator